MALLGYFLSSMLCSLLLATSVLAASTTYARFMLHLPGFWPGQSPLSDDFQLVSKDGDVKVPVTLGVMSKCPDALLCESVFDKVVPQVEDKIDLSLSFIGRYAFESKYFDLQLIHYACKDSTVLNQTLASPACMGL